MRNKDQKLDYNLIRYSKNLCIVVVLLFLIYTLILTKLTNSDPKTLISTNLFVTVGFIVCLANLYVWHILKKILLELSNSSNLLQVKSQLFILAFAEFLLFNYIIAFLLTLSIFSYFRKYKILRVNSNKKIITKQLLFYSISLGFFVFLSYLIIFTALTV